MKNKLTNKKKWFFATVAATFLFSLSIQFNLFAQEPSTNCIQTLPAVSGYVNGTQKIVDCVSCKLTGVSVSVMVNNKEVGIKYKKAKFTVQATVRPCVVDKDMSRTCVELILNPPLGPVGDICEDLFVATPGADTGTGTSTGTGTGTGTKPDTGTGTKPSTGTGTN